MNKIFTITAIAFSFLFAIPSSTNGQVSVRDSLALVDLYNSTDGSNWVNHGNWLTGPVKTWYGISTTPTRVYQIQLYNNNLKGTIPASIGNLTRVIYFYLDHNQLTGSIPSQIGNLARADQITLNNNQLSGGLPSQLGNLTGYLQYLNLSYNQLTGSIPSSIGNLSTKLNGLDLSYNQLSGSIPSALGNLSVLSELNLDHNQLTGSIPKELANLNVFNFNLNDNQLSGAIPPELGNLSKVSTVDLSNNQLSGTIPPQLGLKSLNTINLNNNQFTGKIPPDLGNIGYDTSSSYHNSVNINFSNNLLSGNIPSELFAKNIIVYLNLSNNQLTGTLPGNIINDRNYYYISKIDLSNNQLSGELPVDFDSTINMRCLILSHNKFTGSTPAFMWCYNMDTLDLSYNKFSGTIPPDLGNYKDRLRLLDFSHNKFEGKIPSSFSQLTRLNALNLNNNGFSDTVPLFLASFPRLRKLQILHNNFTFDGIESLSQHNFKVFKYGVQKNINVHQNGSTLSANAGGTLSNNTYSWYKNGSVVATIVGDSAYHPTASGTYYVTVTNSTATQLTLKSNTVIYSTGKITALQQDELMKSYTSIVVYPNPAQTIATVSFKAEGKYIAYLSDVNGKLVQTVTGVSNSTVNHFQLKLNGFAKGTYVLTIVDENKNKLSLKLEKS